MYEMIFELFKKAIETNNTVWSKDMLRLQVELAFTMFHAIDEIQYNELKNMLNG